MSSTRPMLLGAFFVIVLGILGYFTLFMTEFSLFKKEHIVVVHFADANGLRQGDTVLVAGLRAGRVKLLVPDWTAPLDQRITITLKLEAPLELREGFTIAIEDSTLLGGKHVVIEPGPPGAPAVPSNVALAGTVAHGALAKIGDLVDDNRASISRIVTKVESVVDDLETGKGTFGRLLKDEELATSLKDGVAKFQKTADNLAALSDDLRAGKGTLGRLFSDEELATSLKDGIAKFQKTADNLAALSDDLRAGKGTFGRLFTDEKLADDVAKAIEEIRGTFDKIQNGEGVFAKLINDPKIAEDLKAAIAKISQVADDLAVASDAIRNAKGTIGKLVIDDGIYVQIQRAIQTITGTLEEYREASPITAFTSVLFSVF